MFLHASSSPFIVLTCQKQEETGEENRKENEQVNVQLILKQSINQSINRLISQRKKNPILGQSIKKIFIKIKQGVVLFKPKHKKNLLKFVF